MNQKKKRQTKKVKREAYDAGRNLGKFMAQRVYEFFDPCLSLVERRGGLYPNRVADFEIANQLIKEAGIERRFNCRVEFDEYDKLLEAASEHNLSIETIITEDE